jgi:hypothetical protein
VTFALGATFGLDVRWEVRPWQLQLRSKHVAGPREQSGSLNLRGNSTSAPKLVAVRGTSMLLECVGTLRIASCMVKLKEKILVDLGLRSASDESSCPTLLIHP